MGGGSLLSVAPITGANCGVGSGSEQLRYCVGGGYGPRGRQEGLGRNTYCVIIQITVHRWRQAPSLPEALAVGQLAAVLLTGAAAGILV